MKFAITFALLACGLLAFTEAAPNKVVCYYGSWAVYRPGDGKFDVEAIDPTLCTHAIFTFVGLNWDGTVKILDSWNEIDLQALKRFNDLKQRNPNLKTLIAIGGWNEGSATYSQVTASASLRKVWIQSALNLVQTYGYDGFDLDWEYPAQRGGAPADKQNYSVLLKEFREEFDKYGLLLTAAVAAARESSDISYEIPELDRYLHFVNVMTYDFHGTWDSQTGSNAPLHPSSHVANKEFNVEASVNAWLERGLRPEKLILGIPIYGRSFTLANNNNNGMGAGITGPGNAGPYTREAGMLGYNEICELQLAGGYTTVWENEQEVPYMYNGNQWVSYDNVESVNAKTAFGKAKNLGGFMVWSVETDDFHGKCGTKWPILKAINNAIRV